MQLVLQLPDELQLKILAQLPIPDLLKATVVGYVICNSIKIVTVVGMSKME